MDGCYDTNSSAIVGGEETGRVQGLRRKIHKRDFFFPPFFFPCSSLSEGGSVYLLGTIEFSHLCAPRYSENLRS